MQELSEDAKSVLEELIELAIKNKVTIGISLLTKVALMPNESYTLLALRELVKKKYIQKIKSYFKILRRMK